MASIINLSALYHEEETVLVLFRQRAYTGSGDLLQSHVGARAVDGVSQRGAVAGIVLLLLEEDYAVSVFQFLTEILIPPRNGIARCGTLVVERTGGGGVVLVLRTGEVAARIEVESGCDEVLSYLIIHVAVGTVSVERCRSGMVHRHACAHTYSRSSLFRPHGDAVHRRVLVGEHAYHTVFRLVACGKRGACGG